MISVVRSIGTRNRHITKGVEGSAKQERVKSGGLEKQLGLVAFSMAPWPVQPLG